MDLSRRQKYTGHTHKISKIDKVKLSLDLSTLNLFCSYILSENRNIKRSQLINMRNLFDTMDVSEYSDNERNRRINFIQKGIDARLNFNLTKSEMILKHINGGILDNDLIDINSFSGMSNAELAWINGTIAKSLDYAFVYTDVDKLIDAGIRFKASEYNTKDEAVVELKRLIMSMNAEFRRHESRAIADERFSLMPEPYENVMRDAHESLSNPSNKLRTMMQGMNEMLNGGFEGQRVYYFFGLPGEGKSTTLLDLALQIKKANREYKPKDPTKIPCIVFLTMENSIRETIQRIWDMVCDRPDMTTFTVEEAMEHMREDGELYISGDNPIDIIIKYAPGESVDTGYLYTLVEDLEDDGYECICLIQDYIKKIRPVYNANAEMRVQYGSIVNEEKVFATIKDIPVISASQLNRDATKHIDEGRKTNKTDLVRLLGRDNIGESQLILENIDAGYFITPEYDMEGNKYLGIQKIKSRFKPTILSSIFQPYISRCEIKMAEDLLDNMPVYKTTMRPDSAQIQNRFNTSISSSNVSMYKGNSIKEYDDMALLNEDDNIYNRASSMYSSKPPTAVAHGVTCWNATATQQVLIKPLIKKDLLKPLIRGIRRR